MKILGTLLFCLTPMMASAMGTTKQKLDYATTYIEASMSGRCALVQDSVNLFALPSGGPGLPVEETEVNFILNCGSEPMYSYRGKLIILIVPKDMAEARDATAISLDPYSKTEFGILPSSFELKK